ncbi:MAG TPA: formylglycine-generating enzyme family protein [bacterium]|nr:formylglycine-generating enzyme family protein [bacterium]
MRTIMFFGTIALLALLLAACTETESIYEVRGKDIGPAGGKYEGVHGVTLIVPKKALDQTITFTIYALDTDPFTNLSATLTNIYSITPMAYKFEAPVTVIIPYEEEDIQGLLDEVDLKPYFAIDRKTFEEIPSDEYEQDLERNIFKVSTKFLGYFHIGFPKEMVKKENSETTGISEMVLIPAGTFEYGAPAGTPTGAATATDGVLSSDGFNTVQLSEYYIDKYEVTNAQYRVCQNADVCTEPYTISSSRYPNYYYDPAYQNFPVLWVSWNQANTFCQWAGKELPTEAQWEKAARGESYRKYPWGDTAPQDNAENSIVNYSALFEDVTDVSSFENAVSSYGIYNMAGNAAEWTATWYDIDSYYKKSADSEPAVDPTGPADGGTADKKVIRGGSWVSLEPEITTYARDKAFPHYRYYNLGFRCAKGGE